RGARVRQRRAAPGLRPAPRGGHASGSGRWPGRDGPPLRRRRPGTPGRARGLLPRGGGRRARGDRTPPGHHRARRELRDALTPAASADPPLLRVAPVQAPMAAWAPATAELPRSLRASFGVLVRPAEQAAAVPASAEEELGRVVRGVGAVGASTRPASSAR